MIRSIYTAAANMVAQLNRQTVIANNIANVDTPGYKQDVTISEQFSSLLLRRLGSNGEEGPVIGTVGTGVMMPQLKLDRSQGELVTTGRPLDLALAGPGFLVVQTAEGARYTRAGVLQQDASGMLATVDGGLVLGRNGPVRLMPGSDVIVKSDGRILQNDQQIDQLQLVEFPEDARLRKVGGGYLLSEDAEPLAAVSTTILQGTVEQSNVDPLRATSEMMAALRMYQANQQVIQLQDQTLERAISDIGRVS